MFAPVYTSVMPPVSVAERRAEIRGFIIAVFRFRDIIESALEVLEPEGIDLVLRDLSAPANDQVLYRHAARIRTNSVAGKHFWNGFQPGDYEKSFVVGGRSWTITESPDPYFMHSRQDSVEWLVLLTGLAISLLLPAYLVVTARQAERMRQTEIALLQARSELEQRVEERTRDLNLAQEELIKQGRLATLGQLTATVSHELRNPLALTTVEVVRQQLRATGLDRNIDTAIGRLVRAIERCDRIIDELLDYTRLRVRTMDVTGIDGFLDGYLVEHPVPADIILQKNLTAGAAQVEIDRELLNRVLLNIIDNACQAMVDNKGDKRLTLMSAVIDGHCRITVKDNGPGMTAKIRGKIFEPLYSTKAYGVGLGMAIVKQIMEQLGGYITVESEPGQGAEISLWLPLARPAST